MSHTAVATIKEYFQLFTLNLKLKVRAFAQYLKVIFNYYSSPSFAKVDAYLTFSYLWRNPFGISKRFLIHRGSKDIYAYGETPLQTLEGIVRECRLSVHDRVFELGCGRGRTCFWLHYFVGCSVVGIDYVPEFIERCHAAVNRFDIKDTEFRCEDFLFSDFSGATVLYLYGTCLEDTAIRKLINRLSELPKGTKVITVSFSLNDYDPNRQFEVMKRFSAPFTWGVADVYLQIRK